MKRLYFYTFLQKSFRWISKIYFNLVTRVLFKLNHVRYGCDLHARGIPYISMSYGSKFVIGSSFKINNHYRYNPIGIYGPCQLIIGSNAKIIIGDNVGISQTALIAHSDIIIGNNVKIGAGSKLYSTNFHSLNFLLRRETSSDKVNTQTAPISIGDDVFIGAGCIILKGVKIGNRSIIGAGSVLTKSVPQDEIWGGNPAKMIRKIIYEKES